MVDDAVPRRCRVLISYAHEGPEHDARVKELAELLDRVGVHARLDQLAPEERRDWVAWTLAEMRRADRVVVVASDTYRRRFESEAPSDEGRGVQLEALLIREEIYRNQRAALRKFIPVLLPGATQDDIPTLLLPYSGTHYRVHDASPAGADALIRLLTGSTPEYGTRSDRAAWSGVPSGAPLAALHLVTTGGTALAADDVVRCLVQAGAGGARTEFDDDTRTMGAVVVGPPADVVDVLARATRAIRARIEVSEDDRRSRRLLVRIGAHSAVRTEEATLRATELANCPAARRMHDAPGADVVLATSAEFFRDLEGSAEPYPRRRAFRRWPSRGDSGTPCWIAVPGRPPVSALPPEAAGGTPSVTTAPTAAPRFTIGVNDRGTVTYAERDATVNVVNHFGGSA